MNIYDPMDRIVYRHLDPPGTRSSVAMTGEATVDLPSGYANRSPRTYLRAGRRSPRAA